MTIDNEIRRLKALRSYQILGTEPSGEFDELTALAASICNAPMSMINLVDEEEQWSKSLFGVSGRLRKIPRKVSVCQYTILENALFEVTNLRKDKRFKDFPYVKNEPRITYYLGAPLADPDGNIIGVLCVMDVKERKMEKKHKHQLRILANQVMAHLELVKQNIKLQELNKHKMNLMKILSHDIRSPLSGIIGMSSLLLETTEFEDPETRQLLQLLAQSARQMNLMINDILNYTITGSSGFTLNLKETDVFYSIEHVKKLYEPVAALKNIELDFNIKDINKYLLLDSEKFEQILGNLLSNAIKFTPENGKVESTLALEKENDFEILVLRICDNGIGMDDKMTKELIKTNSKYERSGTKGEISTGLGLSIVRHFTDLHGGSIAVDSIPKEGTTFTIRFPLTKEQEQHPEQLLATEAI
jgi:two-component system, sensor histidine kinase